MKQVNDALVGLRFDGGTCNVIVSHVIASHVIACQEQRSLSDFNPVYLFLVT